MVTTQQRNTRANVTRSQHLTLSLARLKPLSIAVRVAVAGGLSIGALPGMSNAELPNPATAWAQQSGMPNVYQLGTTTATFSNRALTVDQRDDKVVLDWDSFNISAGNTVTFQQPGKDSVAINRITNTARTEIFGTLNANGQVYLINTNGILFGRGSQVNVHTLIASSLEMSQEAIDDGILAPGVDNNPAFEGTGTAAVNIESGAVLTANGGRILVFAPEITNAGLIQSPDGQTVLAAGQKIYISKVELNGSSHPELVGQLLVEVDVSGVTPEELQAFLRGETTTLSSGTASNSGIIEALRGNVSMVGLAVNQTGRVSATTSVSQNGSIRLVAQDRGNDVGGPRGGQVVVGADSTTEIALELDSTDTAVDAEEQKKSNITLAGHSVYIEDDAQIIASSGEVVISASASGSDAPSLVDAETNDSRVSIADGATIDVSGANIAMPVSSNYLEVELRGSQLQNSYYQKDGILKNSTIVVDIRKTGTRADGSTWIGTPLADLTGDVAAIGRTVGERSLEGGTVTIASQGDVLAESGSTIDISGGAIQYTDAEVSTTKLVSNGRVYDIADAPEDLYYSQILNTFTKNYEKWGVQRIWDIVPYSFELGYLHGYDAGTFNLIASRGALEGTVFGGVIVGPRQREDAPQGGTFVFGFPLGVGADGYDNRSPSVLFSWLKQFDALLADSSNPFNVHGGVLPSAFDTFLLSPDLFGEDGVHTGRIYSNGRILVPEAVSLVLPAGGALSLIGSQVDVQGDITVPAGTVELRAVKTITAGLTDMRVDVGAHSRIDTRGAWVNDNPLLDPTLVPIRSAGGSVSISSVNGTGVFLAAGSSIDVSGGGWLKEDGQLQAGAAGSIDLSVDNTAETEYAPVQLLLDGTLSGYGLGRGGSLSLEANEVCIGTSGCADASGLVIAPEYFQQGGFSDYALSSNNGGVTVASDAQIKPMAESLLLNSDFALQRSGTEMALFTRREFLPVALRTPTSLSLSVSAKNTDGFSEDNFAQAGFLDMQAGSRILLDAFSSVSLESNTRLYLAGSIVAPAGSISLQLTNGLALNKALNDADTYFISTQSIWLSDSARLDARGVAQVQPNALGQPVGEVYNGGEISLQADRGYIVTEAGSSIDVSGAAADMVIANGNQGFVTNTVASDAGSIELSAAEGMLLDGALQGVAGGQNAAGGKLSIVLDDATRNEASDAVSNFPNGARVITIAAAAAAAAQIPDTLTANAAAEFDAINGQARIAEATIEDGGFDQLELTARNLFDKSNALSATGSVRLQDGVDLHLERSIIIDAAAVESPGTAALEAAYVALGSTNRSSQDVAGSVAGDGDLEITADLIDIIGHSRLQEVANVALNSQGDIRLRGVQLLNSLDLSGSLTSDGDMQLRADQIYPTTLSDVTLEVTAADGTLTILPGDADTAPVLSAGGSLHLRADNINQFGTLKAPIGLLDLVAAQRLVLGDGSVTSTSAAGETIPFGRIEASEDWVYALQESYFRVFTGTGSEALPQKRVILDGEDIEVRDGAIVDLSGGGDLLAYEFSPGVDGTIDILDPSVNPNLFAILPGSGLEYAPYDAQEMVGSTLQVGDSVYLSASAGVAAGNYVLLPARYALLPGAWLVQAVAGYTDVPLGSAISQRDGTTLVSGYNSVAGTAIQDSRSSAFALRPGSDVELFARYDTALANDFFPDAAARNETATPRLPDDAGTLAIAPRNSLLLQGSLTATAASGARGSAVDISADLLAVVGASGGASLPAGYVQIDAQQLNEFGIESLLLGALRERGAEATTLDVRATEVRITGDVDLNVPDLVIAANQLIQIDGGAQLTASGVAQTGDEVLAVEGDGALLRLSADQQVLVDRGDTSTGTVGDLIIGAGAQLTAAESAVLDATHDTQSDGDLIMDGGSLNLGAYRISLGAAAGVTEGLVLGNDDLNQASVDELVLTSRTSVDIYGAVAVDAQDLRIEAAGINGYGDSGDVSRVQAAGTITLSNRLDVADADAATGAGTLQLSASDAVIIGEGEFMIRGYSATQLEAGREIVGDGTGTLSVAGDLSLSAPRITATRGADTTIQAVDNSDPDAPVYYQLNITAAGTRPDDLPLAELGARMNIIGADIVDAGTFELAAGLLSLEARGDGADDSVTLASGSNIDLSGRTLVFDGEPVYAPAGTLTITSAAGDVSLNGAIELSATGAGAAGRLVVNAGAGDLSIGGTLTAAHGVGGTGGEVTLDANNFGNFSALNTQLNQAGFDALRDLRQRSGDITIASSDHVSAEAIQITADAGSISVAGSLDASGDAGGRIQLNAETDITLTATGELDASASTDEGEGGRVDLRSDSGAVFLDGGSVIDVRGGADANGGKVYLRLPRASVLSVLDMDSGNDQLRLAANILGAAEQFIEGSAVYTESDGDISSAQVLTSSVWYTDASSFISASAGAAAAAGDSEFTIIPGVEIQSPGDLTLSADWNLYTWRFNGQPGVLTLRAGGDLFIGSATATSRSSAGAISDGFTAATTSSSTTSAVQTGASWSYRLVAGADQSSANLLAVQSLGDLNYGGDFKLAKGTGGTTTQTRVVRTGTGDIDIAAAQDFILGNAQSVVYTAGTPSTGGYTLTRLGSRAYPDNGGDVSVQAGRDMRGVESNQLVSNWLFRAGLKSGALSSNFSNNGWTVAYELFYQGIGALGGGNVNLQAGGDIDNISAVVPSIGKQITSSSFTANNQVEVIGGGDLYVEAGGDIKSGLYFVGMGDGTINAGGGLLSNRSYSGSPLYTIFALGDGMFDVHARSDATVETVFNPTLVPQSTKNATSSLQYSYYSTYGQDSGVSVSSVAGDVTFNNDFSSLASVATGQGLASLTSGTFDQTFLGFYAPTLQAHALTGDVIIDGTNLWMYPAAKGDLELYAGQDVLFSASLGENKKFLMLDLGDDVLPTLSNPSVSLSSGSVVGTAIIRFDHAAVPVHSLQAQPDGIADNQPVHIVAASGDIVMLSSLATSEVLKTPKATRLVAGRDIRDIALDVTHVSEHDVSALVAGRDIVYSAARNSGTGALGINQRQFYVNGPGLIEFLAGRNVDLSTMYGVITNGNSTNLALADQGADVLVMAGLNGALPISDYIAAYDKYFVADAFAAEFRTAVGALVGGTPTDNDTALAMYRALDANQQATIMVALDLPERYADSFAGESDAQGVYQGGYFDDLLSLQTRIADFVRAYSADSDMTDAAALQVFAAFDEPLQHTFVTQSFFNELKWSGRVDARTGNNEYPLGFSAIDTLFPRDDYEGDIKLVLSTFRTLDGGDITLLTPGGRINAGLSTPPASLGGAAALASNNKLLGVVAQFSGDVRVFADSDIQVEESRIFAGDGGDILAWSSNGDVDAGRGAKTALSVPPPSVTFDDQGNVTIVASASLQGSGIRAFASSEGVTPGDVDLYAPRGVVNAGDAGIGGGNITLGATAILGADNIDVGGVSVGVPVADTGSLAAGLTGLSNLSSSVSKMAEDSASGLGGDDAMNDNDTLGFLSVDILGFGE